MRPDITGKRPSIMEPVTTRRRHIMPMWRLVIICMLSIMEKKQPNTMLKSMVPSKFIA